MTGALVAVGVVAARVEPLLQPASARQSVAESADRLISLIRGVGSLIDALL
jgi:hypothetical protein